MQCRFDLSIHDAFLICLCLWGLNLSSGLSIFLFFRSFIKKDIPKIIVLFYKRKSCINQPGFGYNKSINPKRYLKGKRKKIEEFIIDEILIKIGSELIDMALGCYYRN